MNYSNIVGNKPLAKDLLPKKSLLLSGQSTGADVFVHPRITVGSCDAPEDDASDTPTQSSGGDDDYYYRGRTADGGGGVSDCDNSADEDASSPVSTSVSVGHKRQCRAAARTASPRLFSMAGQQQTPTSTSLATITVGNIGISSIAARNRHRVLGASSVPRALADAAGRLSKQASNLALNPRTASSSHVCLHKTASGTATVSKKQQHADDVGPRKRRGGVEPAVLKQKVPRRQRAVNIPSGMLFRSKQRTPSQQHRDADDVCEQVAALAPYVASSTAGISPSLSLADDFLLLGSGLFSVSNGAVIVQQVAVNNKIISTTVLNEGNAAARFTANYAAEMFGIRLQVVAQPEAYHRARYQKEGSRGCIKGRDGQDFPSVQLIGYSEGPVVLQAFLGRDSPQRPTPNVLYKACKVGGKQVGVWQEKIVNDTPLLECQLSGTASKMTAALDCLGVMKVRNADLEQALAPTTTTTAVGAAAADSSLAVTARRKRGSAAAKARIVFRAVMKAPAHVRSAAVLSHASTAGVAHTKEMPADSEIYVVLHAISSTITCTSSPGTPEIHRISHEQVPASGGVDMFVIGKNFVKDDSCVIIREPVIDADDSMASRSDDDPRQHHDAAQWAWEAQLPVNKDFFQATHLIVRMPPYVNRQQHDSSSFRHPFKLLLFVHNQSSGMESEGYPFQYMPTGSGGEADKPTAVESQYHLAAKKEPRTVHVSGSSSSRQSTEYSPARSGQTYSAGNTRPAAAPDSDGDAEIIMSTRAAATTRRRATAPHVYYPYATPENSSDRLRLVNSGTTTPNRISSPVMVSRLMISPSFLSTSRGGYGGGSGFTSVIDEFQSISEAPPPPEMLTSTTPPATSSRRRASMSHTFSGGVVEELPASSAVCRTPSLLRVPLAHEADTTTTSLLPPDVVSFAPPQSNAPATAASASHSHLLDVGNLTTLLQPDLQSMSTSPLLVRAMAVDNNNINVEQPNVDSFGLAGNPHTLGGDVDGALLTADAGTLMNNTAAVHSWLGVSHAHHHHAARHRPYPSSTAPAATACLAAHHSHSQSAAGMMPDNFAVPPSAGLVYQTDAAAGQLLSSSSLYLPTYTQQFAAPVGTSHIYGADTIESAGNGADDTDIINIPSFYTASTAGAAARSPIIMPFIPEQSILPSLYLSPSAGGAEEAHQSGTAGFSTDNANSDLLSTQQHQQQQDDILLGALDDLLNESINAGFFDGQTTAAQPDQQQLVNINQVDGRSPAAKSDSAPSVRSPQF